MYTYTKLNQNFYRRVDWHRQLWNSQIRQHNDNCQPHKHLRFLSTYRQSVTWGNYAQRLHAFREARYLFCAFFCGTDAIEGVSEEAQRYSTFPLTFYRLSLLSLLDPHIGDLWLPFRYLLLIIVFIVCMNLLTFQILRLAIIEFVGGRSVGCRLTVSSLHVFYQRKPFLLPLFSSGNEFILSSSWTDLWLE